MCLYIIQFLYLYIHMHIFLFKTLLHYSCYCMSLLCVNINVSICFSLILLILSNFGYLIAIVSPLIYLLINLNITVLSHIHFYVNHISYMPLEFYSNYFFHFMISLSVLCLAIEFLISPILF